MSFVRSGGFSQFCEAILTRGLFGDDFPEKMVDAQQACLVSCSNQIALKVCRLCFVIRFGLIQISVAGHLLASSWVETRRCFGSSALLNVYGYSFASG